MYAYEAALMGVIEATKFARQYKWTHLWFECDSPYIVNLLRSRSREVPWKLLAIPVKILNYLGKIRFHATHIYREGNHVADKLALLGFG